MYLKTGTEAPKIQRFLIVGEFWTNKPHQIQNNYCKPTVLIDINLILGILLKTKFYYVCTYLRRSMGFDIIFSLSYSRGFFLLFCLNLLPLGFQHKYKGSSINDVTKILKFFYPLHCPLSH